MTVTSCSTAAEGAELASRPEFTMVICDLMLAEMSGLEVIGRSKKLHPWRPTILMTAYESKPNLSTVGNQIDDVLLKPFSRDVLAARVLEMTVKGSPSPKPTGRTVLAIGAHPDDVELGCGGILARHVENGDRVVVATMTRGAYGGIPEARALEAGRSAAVLGAKLVLEDLPDTSLGHCPALIPTLGGMIETFVPNVVYTHTNADMHQDHRAVHAATLIASRSVRNVYCYESPSSTRLFQPTLFVDVESFLEEKAAMLSCYGGQKSRPYFNAQFIQSTARYWGRYAGYRLVEPLEVVRSIG
jgi:two-component system, NtrC family, response regulator HydG